MSRGTGGGEGGDPALPISSFATGADLTGAVAGSVNLFTGDVALPLTLVTVPGRGGLTASVGALYSSGTEEALSTWNLEAPTGAMGLGWSLGFDRIVADHKGTGARLDDDFYYGSQRLLEQTAPGGSAYQLFRTEAQPTWEFRYAAATETWMVYRDDGVVMEFGNKDSGRSTVAWMVRWGSFLGPAYDAAGQSRYATGWNLSKVTNLFGESTTYVYEEEEGRLGPGYGAGVGLAFTQAMYLKRVTGPDGQSAELVYEQKCNGSGQGDCLGDSAEYLDPHIEAPNEPDAYQEQYETRFLRRVDAKTAMGSLLFSVELGYNFVVGSGLASATAAKRRLVSVTHRAANGETLPPLTFAYTSLTEQNPSALSTVTAPSGAVATYTYTTTTLGTTDSGPLELTIDRPLGFGGEPRVWNGNGYVIIGWHKGISGDNNDQVRIEAYQWVGGWVGGLVNTITTAEQRSGSGGSTQNYEVILGEGHFTVVEFAVTPYDSGSRKYIYTSSYAPDPTNPSGWLSSGRSMLEVASAGDFSIVDGDRYVAVSSRQKGTLNVLTWNGRAWSSGFAVPTDLGGEDFHLVGTGNWLIAHQASVTGLPDKGYLFVLNGRNTWSSGVPCLPSGFNVSSPGAIRWSAGPSYAIAAGYFASSQPNTGILVGYEIIISWDESYVVSHELIAGYTNSTDVVPVAAGELASVAKISNYAFTLFQRNGSGWATTGVQNAFDRVRIGGGYALSNSAFSSAVRVHQFDPHAGVFVTRGSVPSQSFSGAYSTPGFGYFTLSPAGSFYTAIQDRNGTWPMSITPSSFSGYVVTSPTFMALNNNNISGGNGNTGIYYFKNGLVDPIPTVYAFTIARDGLTGQQIQPIGPNSYTTYCDTYCFQGSITSTSSIRLHRVANRKSRGQVTDHPVALLSISDGFQVTNSTYDYTASTATLDVSGTAAQYNEVTTYAGTTNANQPRYGSTKTYFFNGFPLNALGPTAQPYLLTNTNVSAFASRLVGTPYTTLVLDNAGTQVASEKSAISIYRPIMEGGLGFLPRVTANESIRDGVTITGYKEYNWDNGYLVNETVNHWREGQGIAGKSTRTYYRYFQEGYTGGPTNLASPVIEVTEQVLGTTIRSAATTWKDWGNGHWAPYETFVFTELLAPVVPGTEVIMQQGPPIECTEDCPPPPPPPPPSRTTYEIFYNGQPYFTWFPRGPGQGGTPTSPTWLRTSRVISRTSWGGARESEGIDGVRASVQYDGAGYPTAAFSNASVSENVLGADASWLDFESGDETSGIAANDYWGFYVQNDFSTDAHSGRYSRSLQGNLGNGPFGPTRVFQPTDQNGRYVFSAWVKTAPGFGAGLGHFAFSTRVLGSTEGSPGVSAGYGGVNFGDTNGQWVYLEGVVDLAAVRAQSGVTAPLQLICYIYHEDGSHELLIDDLRFSPLVGGFTATTYDPVTRLATAAHGVNGSASFTSYDAFGRGIEARDRRGRVMAESFGALSREKTGGAFSTATPNEAVQRSYPTANLVANGTLELGAGAGGGAAGWTDAQRTSPTLTRGAFTGRYGLQLTATGNDGFVHSALYDRGALKPNTTYRYSVMARCASGGACDAEAYLMRRDAWGNYILYANAVFSVTDASWRRYTGTITTSGDGRWSDGSLTPTLRLDVNTAGQTVVFDDIVVYEGAVDTPPTYAVSYSDGAGKPRQSQVLSAGGVIVTESLYDFTGRAVAQTLPARIAGASFGYRPNFVDEAASGAGGDGQFGASNPDGTSSSGALPGMATSSEVVAENPIAGLYPYAQTRFERSPLGRPLESGQVGPAYRVGGSLTTLYTYGTATGFPGIGTASKYFMTTVSTPDDAGSGRISVQSVTDMLGRTYATRGAPVAVASGSAVPVTWYDYNDRGDLYRTRLPRYAENPAFKAETTYDFAGRPLTSSSADAGTTRTIYDTAGRPRFTQHADGDGTVGAQYILYTKYDRVGRPVESGYVSQTWDAAFLRARADEPAWPATPTTWRQRSVYDRSPAALTRNQGRLLQAETNRDATTAAEAIESYTYDDRGRTVSVELTVSAFSATPRVVGYAYNDRGDVRTVIYGPTPTPSNQVSYTYDDMGRVSGIGTPYNSAAYRTYAYRTDGQIGAYFTGDENQTSLSYDELGRLKQIQAPGFSETLTYTPGRGLIQAAAYSYTGNATLAGLSHSFSYAYDAAGQLTSADHSTKNALDIGMGAPTQYDLHGNITQLQRGTGGAAAYTYTAGTNRLYSAGSGPYTYDRRGNVRIAPGGREFDTYDPFSNQLTQFTSVGAQDEYYYTYLGRRRVFKTDYNDDVTTLYVHGASDYPLWTEGAGGTVIHVYGPDGLVATVKAGQVPRYVIADHLGSTRALLNIDAGIEEAYTYGAYGETADVYQGGTVYRYTGQELDAESGLLNYRARLYDPVLGRFLATDPQGQFASPYVYVGNNPVMVVDPNGEFAFILAAAVIGAYLGGSKANGTLNPFGWDWSSGRTWAYVAGGAALGAAGAGAGAALASAVQGPVGLATGSGLAAASVSGAAGGAAAGAINSTGMFILDGFSGMYTGSLFGSLSGGVISGAVLGSAQAAARFGLSSSYRWSVHKSIIEYAYKTSSRSDVLGYVARAVGVDPGVVDYEASFENSEGFPQGEYSRVTGRIRISEKGFTNGAGEFDPSNVYETVWHEAQHYKFTQGFQGSIGQAQYSAQHAAIYSSEGAHPYYRFWSDEVKGLALNGYYNNIGSIPDAYRFGYLPRYFRPIEPPY